MAEQSHDSTKVQLGEPTVFFFFFFLLGLLTGGRERVTYRDWNDPEAAWSPRVPPNTGDSQKLQPGALCMPCRQLQARKPQSLASVGPSSSSYSLLL